MAKNIETLAKDFGKLIKKHKLSNARIAYTETNGNKEICELIDSEGKIWLHKHQEIWKKLR